MADFVPVHKINVSLWGMRVGTIIPYGGQGYYAFKYERSFLKTGLEISPLMMPLREAPYIFENLPKNEYYGLPPVFADSLPDSFGTLLIDRWMEERGYLRSRITALDRLAYIGKRGMGALTYEPDRRRGGSTSALEMRRLVESARRVVNGELSLMEGEAALREIIRIGSSAGGAQAKAVIGWNRKTGDFLLGDVDLPEGFEHWIIKFTPKEYPWRGEKEFRHYERAIAEGVDMSESCLYELDGLKHFMTKRFDRDSGNRRKHLLSLSAMAHFPMSVPLEMRSYEQLLLTCDRLKLSYEDRRQAFRRICFNVRYGEFDDHTKNFAFLMDENGTWHLAPAYDLTGSDYPVEDPWNAQTGSHMLSVCGKFSGITEDDLHKLADRFAIGR